MIRSLYHSDNIQCFDLCSTMCSKQGNKITPFIFKIKFIPILKASWFSCYQNCIDYDYLYLLRILTNVAFIMIIQVAYFYYCQTGVYFVITSVFFPLRSESCLTYKAVWSNMKGGGGVENMNQKGTMVEQYTNKWNKK